MIAPSTLDKINALPEEVQVQLFLYVDFLFAVYRSESEEGLGGDFFEKFELTPAGRAFLEKRAKLALEHPERQKPWRKVLSLPQNHDWWEGLNEADMASIEEGNRQMEREEGIAHTEVRKRAKEVLRKRIHL